jgi:hypothetical protein
MYGILFEPEPLADTLSSVIGTVARISAKNTDRQIKADFDIWFDPLLNEYLQLTMFDKVAGIHDGTTKAIGGFRRKYEAQVIAGSLDPQKLMRELQNEWGILSRMRALRIARTEVAAAANFGSLKAAENSEVIETKTWNAVFKNTRDQHADMHGSTVAINDVFYLPNGDTMQSPLDMESGAGPENIVNCQCYLTFD